MDGDSTTRAIVTLLACLSAPLGSPAQAPRLPEDEVPPAVIEALASHAVRIDVHTRGGSTSRTRIWMGSGVLYGDVVLTNNHVAGDDSLLAAEEADIYRDPEIVITAANGRPVIARKTGFTREAFSDDTAALPIEKGPPGIDAFVNFEDLDVGDRLYALGNTFEESFILTQGVVVDLPQRRGSIQEADILRGIEASLGERNRYDRAIVVTDISEGGFSGGPVVDQHGRLAGLIVAGSDPDRVWSGSLDDTTIVLPLDAVFRSIGKTAPRTTKVDKVAAPTREQQPLTRLVERPPSAAATPESYPLARATPIDGAHVPAGVQAWSLNVSLGEVAGVDGLQWGHGASARKVPLVLSAYPVAVLPTPPAGTAMLLVWTAVQPPAVVLVLAPQAKDDGPLASLMDLTTGSAKTWQVYPAE